MANNREHIIDEWSPNNELSIDDVTAGSHKEAFWICKIHGDYKQRIYHHTIGEQGCPFCAGRAVKKGVNDLATTHPDIAKEFVADPNGKDTPETVTYGSTKIFLWHCDEHGDYLMSVKKRTTGRKCLMCSNKIIKKGVNDLATTHPEIAAEFVSDPQGRDTPETVSYGSKKKMVWRCEKHGNYEMSVKDRAHNHGCPVCSNSKGEMKIAEELKKLGISFEQQYKFDDCRHKYPLRFDFAIKKGEKVEKLIEYDGIQHSKPIEHFGGEKAFKSLQKRDLKKTKYCVKKGIPLIRISYKDINRIPRIIRKAVG